jgi:hypothetical protein
VARSLSGLNEQPVVVMLPRQMLAWTSGRDMPAVSDSHLVIFEATMDPACRASAGRLLAGCPTVTSTPSEGHTLSPVVAASVRPARSMRCGLFTTRQSSSRFGDSMLRFKFTVLIVSLWTALGGTALAADLAAGNAADEATPVQWIAIDSGVTAISPLSPYRLDGYIDALIAPAGDLDKSGFRLQVGSEDWSYRQIQNHQESFGLHKEASLLMGYALERESYSLGIMAGPEVQDGAGSRANSMTTSLGWKSSIELNAHPTQSTILNAQGSYSTASNYFYSQMEVGYALTGDFYIGPVVAFAGDYPLVGAAAGAEGRVGLGVSGIKIGGTELGFEGGYSQSVLSADDNIGLLESGRLRERNDDQAGFFADTNIYVRY